MTAKLVTWCVRCEVIRYGTARVRAHSAKEALELAREGFIVDEDDERESFEEDTGKPHRVVPVSYPVKECG